MSELGDEVKQIKSVMLILGELKEEKVTQKKKKKKGKRRISATSVCFDLKNREECKGYRIGILHILRY